MFAKSAIFASLAALASAGSVSVINNSDQVVHLWSIVTSAGGNPNDGNLNVVNPNGGTYSEAYQNVVSGGVSIKIGPSSLTYPGSTDITQLEYTYVPGQGLVYWDLSNINGNPFSNAEVTLTPSTPDKNACVVITCPPGPKCLTAYNKPDDTDTHSCVDSVDLVMVISNTGASSSPAPAPVVSSAAPVVSSASVGAIALQQSASAAAPASSSPAPAANPVPVGQAQMAPAAPVVSTTTFVVVVTPTPKPTTSSPAPVAASPTPVAPAEVEPVAASPAPQPYFGVLTEGFFTHDGSVVKHKKRHIHKKRHSRFFQ